MTVEKKKDGETVNFQGVSELLPKFRSGKEAVYFCHYCQDRPNKVSSKQIAVSVSHDECVRKGIQQVLENLEQLNKHIARKTADAVNEILAINPNSDVFDRFK